MGPVVRLPLHTGDVLYLFGFPDGADCCESLFWLTTGRRIRFFANCSDTFAWGTEDVEEILEEDVPLLWQCFQDLNSLEDGAVREYGHLLPDLFAARKRGRRPMEVFLKTEPPEVVALFPAAEKEEET